MRLAWIIIAFKTVFSRARYAALALSIAMGLFLFVAWLPNWDLLKFALLSKTISFWKLIAQSHQFFTINTTFATASITAAVIALSSINITLLVYYLRRRVLADQSASIGILGTLVGLLGVGCAACGSVIISSLFGLGASASFLGFLPFRGIELGIIGIVALIASIALLARKIQNPAVCAIER